METKVTIVKLIEEESQNRFNKSWIKLDKGSKINRIFLFIKKEKIKNELTDTEELRLKELLLKLLDSNCLNKNSNIEYSETQAEILKIKELKYISETKIYSHSIKKKKKTDVSRSKSKIEKQFNKNKDKKK